MLNFILKISLENRLAVLLLALGLSLAGVFVISSMEVDVFPDLTAPTVTILTEAHGMDAAEVENLVTFHIETGLNGSPGVRRIRSSSAAGISIVWVEFDWGTDIFRARQIVSEKIPLITEKLPDEAGQPVLAPVSSIMGEIMLIGLTSDSLSAMELRTLADWEISPRLKAVSGIANVIVIGGEFRQYQVLANPFQMDFYGISMEALSDAVRESNVNASGGFFSQYGNQYVIKGEGRINKPEEIAGSVVGLKDGKPVKIGDVARVIIGPADKIGEGSLNGRPAVVMTISKQPGINTLDLTSRIDRELEAIQQSLPQGVEIHDEIFRQADFISSSVSNLERTLLEGIIFVSIILFLFLMNWRTTIISLLAIPVSLLVSFIVLKFLGYTINTMSLGGMAIAVGVLVDDAIIDVENVYKRLRENAIRPAAMRLPVIRVVLDASTEVRSSIIIATFIIIVAFIPLFFLGGMEGRLLKPLGISFITSVLTSLFIAITMTPVLCSYLLKNPAKLTGKSGTLIEKKLKSFYYGILRWVTKNPLAVIVPAAAIFCISVAGFFGLGRNFLPEFNEGSLVISVVGPPGMSLEESNKIGTLVEEILLEVPEIDIVTRRTGRAELDEHAQGVNASEVDAPFVLMDRSREEFLADVRERLAVVPGVNITIGQPIAHRIDHMLSGTRANIAVKIFGKDLDKLFAIGKEVEQELKAIPGLVDINLEQQIEVPQIRIRPKRELLAVYGLTAKDFSGLIDHAFRGEVVSQVYEGQRNFDLVVRYDSAFRGSTRKISAALIDFGNGSKVPLSQVAEVISAGTPHLINREGVMRKVVVSANVSGTDLVEAVKSIQKGIQTNIQLPDGYFIDYGGQFENAQQASRLLLISSLVAIFIIFILLFFEFGSWKLAGIILLNLPLALAGGILVVWLGPAVISIATVIGFISLFGIATRNGILMISRFQALEEAGFKGRAMIIKGAMDRVTAIMMTALTTALALVPIVINSEAPGNEIQAPMAVVILGGLFSATILNMLVIPAVYALGSVKHKQEH